MVKSYKQASRFMANRARRMVAGFVRSRKDVTHARAVGPAHAQNAGTIRSIRTSKMRCHWAIVAVPDSPVVRAAAGP